MKLPIVALRSAAFCLAAAVLWTTISVADAQVYKCTDASGKTTYGDSACDAAAKPLKLPEDPTKGIGSSPRVCADSQTNGSRPKRSATRARCYGERRDASAGKGDAAVRSALRRNSRGAK
jgi:hypothetical protein